MKNNMVKKMLLGWCRLKSKKKKKKQKKLLNIWDLGKFLFILNAKLIQVSSYRFYYRQTNQQSLSF